MRYLLDTHALVWLLSSQDRKLPRDIRESVRYCEDAFFVSELSLIEIIQLQQTGRIDLGYTPQAVRNIVSRDNIIILSPTPDIIDVFYGMEIPVINGNRHSDPFDRIIIATAIKRDLVLVSADQKFPWYAANCHLQLRQI